MEKKKRLLHLHFRRTKHYNFDLYVRRELRE